MIKCDACNTNMKLRTVTDGCDSEGYLFECPICEDTNYSEITWELEHLCNTEEERRVALKEYEV